MGHKHSKKKNQEETIEDMVFNMRLTSKHFQNAAKRAQKEQQKFIEKSRTALKKNNEEEARLFLQGAANKFKEQQNYLRMANRLNGLSMITLQNVNNADLMKNLTNLTPKLLQVQTYMGPEEASKNLNQFQEALDNITIAGRIMDTNLEQNLCEEQRETEVDKAMEQLKKDIAFEINANLATDPDMIFNQVKSQQKSQLDFSTKK